MSRPAAWPLEPYIRAIAGHELLSAAEERELAAAARGGDSAAHDRLVRANLRLVVKIARDFRGRGLDLDDLVAEGNLGLIRAATEFDPGYGVRFSTYAAHWIRQSIRHALITTAAPIRLPAHMVVLLSKWRRAERAMLRATGEPPTFEALAAALGLNEAKRRQVERALRAQRLTTGNGPEDGGDPVAEVAGWSESEDGLEDEDERLRLMRRLDVLDRRERTILELRYGLSGGDPMTLKEIGRRVGATREWVRRLELRALKKLGVPSPPAPRRREPGAA